MRLHIKLFAILRQRASAPEVTLELPEGTTVAAMLAQLQTQHPGLLTDAPSIMVAVNMEYVGHDHAVRNGDEIALIPPVSGGDL